MRGEFTAADGYTTRDLVTYARDHMASARVLFQKSFHCYDSAGYLSHLGIELPLKAFLLPPHGSLSWRARSRVPASPRAGARSDDYAVRCRAGHPQSGRHLQLQPLTRPHEAGPDRRRGLGRHRAVVARTHSTTSSRSERGDALQGGTHARRPPVVYRRRHGHGEGRPRPHMRRRKDSPTR